jgi:hypothetical protein
MQDDSEFTIQNKGSVSKTNRRSIYTTNGPAYIVNGNLYEAMWLIYTLRGLRTPFRSSTVSALIDNIN